MASVIMVPALFGFTSALARYTRRGFRELQRRMGGLNSAMEEAVSGHRVVSAFGRSSAVIAEFRRRNEAVFAAGVYANNYAMTLMPLTGVLGNLFVIVLAGLGGWLALKGLATVGIIATFIHYAQNFIQPLRQLANVYNSVQAALAGAERVFEILDLPPEAEAAPPEAARDRPFRGKIRFADVTFGYHAGVPVIRGMNFEAEAGRTIALVGPTGAGKTTVINLLMRFYAPDAGRITIDGTDIRRIPRARLRGRMGLVLQETFLFSATVMENIRYGRLDAPDEDCVAAARTAGADPFIRQLPKGYQTRLSERAGNLSQGQRQLLAIARVVLMDPDILILDEATSSVDTRTERRIQAALLRLMAGRTSIVIAHRLSTIRDADELLVVHEGGIVETGTHQALLARRGLYHHLTASQFKGRSI
jgi:ATP-binding cassette subfamily B protein